MSRAAGCLLLVCCMCGALCPAAVSVAQTSTAELGATIGASESLDGGRSKGSNRGGQSNQAQNPAGTNQAASKSGSTSHAFDRGSGGYFSLLKIIPWWLLFLLWVKTTDWVSQDTYRLRQNYGLWNSLAFFPFLVAIIISLFIPLFIIGILLMFVAWLSPLTAYIVTRNKTVEAHRRVMTGQHLRYLLAVTVNKLGGHMDVEKKAEYEKGAQVDFKPMGGESERDNTANLLMARQSPGFILVKNLIADALDWRADGASLDFTAETATVRFQIDGIWKENEVVEREAGDVIVAVLKTLANLDINERVKRQFGILGVEYQEKKYKCRLQSQGMQTGERVIMRFDIGKQSFHTLEELGMRQKVAEQLQEVLDGDRGMVLFSSLPEGGLTTTIDVALGETDRLMRNFVSVEPENLRERDIENVEVTTYKSNNGETPATVLPKLIRTYPEVIVVRNLTDGETGRILCEQVDENRLVITSVRAKEAPEALLRMLMLKIPQRMLAGAVSVVVNQRLLRRLCDECKVAYEPSPDMLKKLGIPPGRIETLYREPTAEEIEKPCPKCRGLGYHGRTSIFEVLAVDDGVRNMLLNQPNLVKAKKAARDAGMRTFQEEGILLVAKGTTSVAELARVLKK